MNGYKLTNWTINDKELYLCFENSDYNLVKNYEKKLINKIIRSNFKGLSEVKVFFNSIKDFGFSLPISFVNKNKLSEIMLNKGFIVNKEPINNLDIVNNLKEKIVIELMKEQE